MFPAKRIVTALKVQSQNTRILLKNNTFRIRLPAKVVHASSDYINQEARFYSGLCVHCNRIRLTISDDLQRVNQIRNDSWIQGNLFHTTHAQNCRSGSIFLWKMKTNHFQRDHHTLASARQHLSYSNVRKMCTSEDEKTLDMLLEPDPGGTNTEDQSLSSSQTTDGAKKVAKSERTKKQVKASSPNNISSDKMKPVKNGEIVDYFNKNDIPFSKGYTCYLSTCPRFTRRRTKMKELNKVFINMTTGYFVCLSCKKSGTWADLMDNSDMILVGEKHGRMPECFKHMTLEDPSADVERARDVWSQCLDVEAITGDQTENLLELVGAEGLTVPTLTKYQLRALRDHSGLALPHFGLDKKLIGVKSVYEEVYRVKDSERSRMVTRTVPRIEFHGLFGLNTIKSSHKEVVLTASEFDAMAVHQATGKPALALPKKDSILPQKVLPLLEQFEKIVLWFGGDVKMWETAKQFARKLNDTRCFLVRPDESQPGALVALQKGLKLSSILDATKPVKHKSITSFRSLRQDVLTSLTQAEHVAGVKWKRYTHLNKLLKGHRRGELSIFTGPTGSGKTTLISDYSLDLCMQGVNTLWGSFEINNVKLMKTMLFQYSQKNLIKNIEEFDLWADKFEQLPMFCMTFHGQENIRKVIETMSHAVYVHDIAHVIVDNLQFMMGVDDFSSSSLKANTDRFYKQDQIIAAFRKFATSMNCHVTLVIHPRKERETDELSISSIFGSAKASQEADNIMIIQDRRAVSVKGRKYLQVVKNRYDGELGVMMLKFDKDSLSFAIKTREKDDQSKEKKDTNDKKDGNSQTPPQGNGMPQYEM